VVSLASAVAPRTGPPGSRRWLRLASLHKGAGPRAYEIVNTLHKMVRPEEILKRLFQFTVLMADAMEEDLSNRGLTRARATLLAHLHDQARPSKARWQEPCGSVPGTSPVWSTGCKQAAW
jgi:hypothetical protein